MSATTPNFDLSGPNVDDDIRRLIQRYGAEKVQQAVKRQKAPPRGRRPEGDWLKLRDVLREDAILWLEGGDPLKARSNYSIAKGLAEGVSDHHKISTYRRIMRKLSSRRYYYTLAEAAYLSQSRYSYAENLRAVRGLQEIGVKRDLWGRTLRLIESSIADYRSKFGDPPAEMTMQELLTESARPIIPTLYPNSGNVLQILMGVRPG